MFACSRESCSNLATMLSLLLLFQDGKMDDSKTDSRHIRGGWTNRFSLLFVFLSVSYAVFHPPLHFFAVQYICTTFHTSSGYNNISLTQIMHQNYLSLTHHKIMRCNYCIIALLYWIVSSDLAISSSPYVLYSKYILTLR